MICRPEHLYSQAFKSFFFSKQNINTFNHKGEMLHPFGHFKIFHVAFIFWQLEKCDTRTIFHFKEYVYVWAICPGRGHMVLAHRMREF